MSQPPFITKIRIRNFKSIQDETVEFANPMFLVGRNGSGKSNFVDALAFVADCMAMPLETVTDYRRPIIDAFSLIRSVREPKGRFQPTEFRIDFADVERNFVGYYSFALGAQSGTLALGVLEEECHVTDEADASVMFRRKGQTFHTNVEGLKLAIEAGAFVLPLLGGITQFAPVWRILSTMRVYAIDPMRVREAHAFTSGFLREDGSNTASVLSRRFMSSLDQQERLKELLQPILPVATNIQVIPDNDRQAVIFFGQRLREGDDDIAFRASDMSDGTLRTLGTIAALMQDPLPSVVALEEPEMHLHAGALALISDLIEIGANRTQVVVTTHSPELLDAKWIQPENLRIVEWTDAGTRILPLGVRPVRALQEHLMTTGELLRSNALDAAPMTRNGTGENTSIVDEVSA